MTLKQKSFKFYYPASVLLNLCIYFLISSITYYLFSLNINLLKLALLCGGFILVFYLSSKKTELLLQKVKLKNIIIIAKFFLGVISLAAAILIYNNFSLSSSFLYLLILTTAILYAVLNKAHNFYYQKTSVKNRAGRNRELITQFNLEKLLIVILATVTAVFIRINLIPLILVGTAVYYFISAYINTFQEI
jgi:hypothetical protein